MESKHYKYFTTLFVSMFVLLSAANSAFLLMDTFKLIPSTPITGIVTVGVALFSIVAAGISLYGYCRQKRIETENEDDIISECYKLLAELSSQNMSLRYTEKALRGALGYLAKENVSLIHNDKELQEALAELSQENKDLQKSCAEFIPTLRSLTAIKKNKLFEEGNVPKLERNISAKF